MESKMLNKVQIIGNLGSDPESRQAGESTVTNFTVATTERWKDRNGEQQESTEWHKIVAWGKLAEICSQYLHKGKQVYVEGAIQTRKWQDKDGNDRYTTEIKAFTMKMLGFVGQTQAPAKDMPLDVPNEVKNLAKKLGTSVVADDDLPF
jgi:single-strand DNA-binding protein